MDRFFCEHGADVIVARNLLQSIPVPRWLSGPVASAYFWAYGAVVDCLSEMANQGLALRYPGLGTPTALPYIGRDRVIARGMFETDAAYATRLRRWLDDWSTAGSAASVLHQLAAHLGYPKIRLVTANSWWWTRAAGIAGQVSLYIPSAPNWNWDSVSNPERAGHMSRAWVIVDCSSGAPLPQAGGVWGSSGGRAWGDGQSIGLTYSNQVQDGVRKIVDTFRAAESLYLWVIYDLTGTNFNQTAAFGDSTLPDGQWGRWHKYVGGVAVPSRSLTCRYVEGPTA